MLIKSERCELNVVGSVQWRLFFVVFLLFIAVVCLFVCFASVFCFFLGFFLFCFVGFSFVFRCCCCCYLVLAVLFKSFDRTFKQMYVNYVLRIRSLRIRLPIYEYGHQGIKGYSFDTVEARCCSDLNALDFRSGGRCFKPGLCRRFVVSLHPGLWVPAIIMLGGNLAMDYHPIQ